MPQEAWPLNNDLQNQPIGEGFGAVTQPVGLVDLAWESRNQDRSLEIAQCQPDSACGAASGKVFGKQAFYLGDTCHIKCSELARSGVFDITGKIEQPYPRSPEEVKFITVQESSDASGDYVPNFRIGADGKIYEVRDPHKKSKEFDPAVEIELQNGAAGAGQDLTEQQKAALRQVISYVKANWSESLQFCDNMQDPNHRIFSAVYLDPLLDDQQAPPLCDSGAFPALPKQDTVRHIWQESPENSFWGGNESDAQQGRACGQYDRVDRMNEAHRNQFIERVKKCITKNEGSYNTITKNDNGSGISVGIAQWNQKYELTTLFKEWYKAAEKEHDDKVRHGRARPGSYNRFEQIFGVFSEDLRDEDFVHKYDFTADTPEAKDLMDRLSHALDDRFFRHVQDELVRTKVRNAIALADKYHHHSTRFIAQVADVTNQYGATNCEAFLRKGNVANIPEDTEGECLAIQAFIDNTPPKKNSKTGEPIYRTRRDQALDQEFPPKHAARLRLVTEHVSEPAQTK